MRTAVGRLFTAAASDRCLQRLRRVYVLIVQLGHYNSPIIGPIRPVVTRRAVVDLREATSRGECLDVERAQSRLDELSRRRLLGFAKVVLRLDDSLLPLHTGLLTLIGQSCARALIVLFDAHAFLRRLKLKVCRVQRFFGHGCGGREPRHLELVARGSV